MTHRACGGAVPVLLTTREFNLDKADARYGDEGRKRPPHGLIQEYLNADDSCLWVLVANGNKMWLLRDNPSLTQPAYVEADLERIFQEQLYPDFAAFWLLFHESRTNHATTNPLTASWIPGASRPRRPANAPWPICVRG